jgi:hypothetical protein
MHSQHVRTHSAEVVGDRSDVKAFRRFDFFIFVGERHLVAINRTLILPAKHNIEPTLDILSLVRVATVLLDRGILDQIIHLHCLIFFFDQGIQLNENLSSLNDEIRGTPVLSLVCIDQHEQDLLTTCGDLSARSRCHAFCNLQKVGCTL